MFIIENKEKKSCFFKETILLANFRRNTICRMLFLTLKNVKVIFLELEIFIRTYILTKVIPIINQVELLRKKQFTVIAFVLKKEVYIVYITNFVSSNHILIFFNNFK